MKHMMRRGRCRFRRRMDELNYMLEDRKFPQDLRIRCRMFLIQSKEQYRVHNYRIIENNFSEQLRLEVAVESNGRWLGRVWYLREAPTPFVAELSQILGNATYAPMEIINLTLTLFILRRGIAARKGRVLAKGSIWGEDFILDDVDLINQDFSAALTFVRVLYLKHHDFMQLASAYEGVAKRIRFARIFYTVRRRMLLSPRLVFFGSCCCCCCCFDSCCLISTP